MSTIKWKNYQGALIPNTPPHPNITLSPQEQKQLLKKSGAYFLRWTSDFDTPQETSFWYILKDKPEGLETYNSKIRNQIKKGLHLCRVQICTVTLIMNEGYDVYQKAFNHYHTVQQPSDKSSFQKTLLSLKGDWEFWEIRNDAGKLIGYSQNYIADNTCNYSTVKLDPDFLPLYPAYALFYTMNVHYLNERHMRYIHDGSRSLSHETNIQDFLCNKFKFRKAYCKMDIAYRNDIAIVVTLLYPFRHLIKHLHNPLFQKLSVLLRHEEIRKTYG
jgi:hypothetical protein